MAFNENQIAFLNYFCDDAHDFDFAIMIDAPWGSGKTFFLREYLKVRFQKISTPPTAPPDYLWVSLFGHNNVSDVRDALFAEAHPMLSSKWSALAGSIGASLVKKLSGFDAADKSLAKRFLPQLKAKLIIFDDLERSSISAVDALGLINSFVESRQFKVIVIANQKPLLGNADYRSQKEKVVGRTLTIMSDPDLVLTELTNSIKCSEARDAVILNRESVLAVFDDSGYHNFRSLRAALDDFDRLVQTSDRRLADSPAALRELLLYLIALGMEIRADAFQDVNLENIFGSMRQASNAAVINPNVTELKKLSDKYPSVSWKNPVISPGILESLIKAGILKLDDINSELAVQPLVVGYAEVPAWRALWNWTQLNATEYGAARRELKDQLSSFSIVHPGILLLVIGSLLWIEEYGDHIFENLEEYFTIYFSVLQQSGTVIPEPSVFGMAEFGGWAGMGYQNTDHPTFKKLLSKLKDVVDSAYKIKMASEAKQLLASLTQPGAESALYESHHEHGQYGGVPLLQNVAVNDFADLLLEDKRLNSHLIIALCRRYEHGRGTAALLDEKQWLVDLEAEIRRRASGTNVPFARLLDKRADHYFGDIKKNIALIESLHAPPSTQSPSAGTSALAPAHPKIPDVTDTPSR